MSKDDKALEDLRDCADYDRAIDEHRKDPASYTHEEVKKMLDEAERRLLAARLLLRSLQNERNKRWRKRIFDELKQVIGDVDVDPRDLYDNWV